MADRIFDIAALNEICRSTGEALPWVTDVLLLPFLDDLDTTLPMLDKALAAGDARQVEELAHRMKGGSGSMGALRMMGVFKRVMDAGRAKQLEGVGADLAIIHTMAKDA